jgi:hypothetical protein
MKDHAIDARCMKKDDHLMLNTRPLIFLDMDDVLCLDEVHHSGKMLKILQQTIPDYREIWEFLVDASAAENLRQLHAKFNPIYVISSSWATYLSREQMCDALTRTQLEFVVQNLHPEWRTPRALSSSRRDEVEWWLAIHRQPSQPFIIIDDSWSGTRLAHSPLAADGHVILCRSGYGFTKKRLKEACGQLQRQGAIDGSALI